MKMESPEIKYFLSMITDVLPGVWPGVKKTVTSGPLLEKEINSPSCSFLSQIKDSFHIKGRYSNSRYSAGQVGEK